MPPKVNKREFGNLGENYAVKLLKDKGYKIIDRNFRSKFGEIDIIALFGDTLVFIEVKTRWSLKFGYPIEAVNARKLQHIKKAAEYYSLIHPKYPKKLAIEVVAIEFVEGNIKTSKIFKLD